MRLCVLLGGNLRRERERERGRERGRKRKKIIGGLLLTLNSKVIINQYSKILILLEGNTHVHVQHTMNTYMYMYLLYMYTISDAIVKPLIKWRKQVKQLQTWYTKPLLLM